MRKKAVLAFVFLAFLATIGCAQKDSGPEESAKPAKASPFVRSAAVGVLDEQMATAKEATQMGTPKIEFPQGEFDFGEVEAGTKVEHVFTFKNTGDAPLKIEKVGSS